MINIYCLINPINNKPFYVGATKGRLSYRLYCHVKESANPLYNHTMKAIVINEIIDRGYKVKIDLLLSCHLTASDFYEKFFYDMLLMQGYSLVNYPSQFFYYSQRTNTRKGRYSCPKIYQKIFFKNTCIIIW